MADARSGLTLDGLVSSLRSRGLELDVVGGTDGEMPIVNITDDSRTVESGAIFCAIRGQARDGHDFVEQSAQRGAVAIIGQEVRTSACPTLVVPDSRTATGHAASIVFGNPSQSLTLVGATGTNGKTTCVTLLEHVAASSGLRSESLGTLTGALTTQPAPELQRRLRRAVDAGVELVAAEVSSHALHQHRVDGTSFDVAVFTNLTQDHLDYHADMKEYFAAKRRLFTPDLSGIAVIDVSTNWGRRLAEDCTIDVVAVDTDAISDDAVLGGRSCTFRWRGHLVTLPLAGRFNVTNALLVAEAAALVGIHEAAIVAGLETTPQVPGRFEHVDRGQPFDVIVDYSHTPASVEAALETAREVAGGRVIVVFGAAGDRDRAKRPLMGRAASSADLLFVTSDNPRTENPEAVIDDVEAGIVNEAVHRITDRRTAIHEALASAEAGDVVVIAGKGHEDYQIVGEERLPFDDRVVAIEALAALGWKEAEWNAS